MILPSDGDGPHGRDDEDDDSPDDDGSSSAIPDPFSETGADDEDEDLDPDDLPDFIKDFDELNQALAAAALEEDEDEEDPPVRPSTSSVAKPAGPGWRRDLKRELAECIDDLKTIEDPDEEFDPPEPPDLYGFFGELAALRNEVRRGLRRTADNVQRCATSIDTLHPADAAPAAWPPALCLSLLSLYDLAAQIYNAAAADLALAPLAAAAGLQRIPTAGRPLDPALMTVAGVEVSAAHSPRTVIREVEAGFLRSGTVLRPARVITAG